MLAIAVIFISTLFTTYFFYRKHISERTQHSIHHVHIQASPPVYNINQTNENLPITILETISYGKFGSVYRANYEGELVAMKIFNSGHRSLWKNERNIYSLESTPHDSILHCICFEQSGGMHNKRFYKISEHYLLGSLDSFLRHNKLSWSQTLKIIHSVSCGLAHLHSNSYINGEGAVEGKFAIAHRDVKSPNVLVKDTSGHCVLGDLGLALILDPNIDDRQMANSGQVWLNMV